MSSRIARFASQARVWRHRRCYRLRGIIATTPSCGVYANIVRATNPFWRSEGHVDMTASAIRGALASMYGECAAEGPWRVANGRMMGIIHGIAKAPDDDLPRASGAGGGVSCAS